MSLASEPETVNRPGLYLFGSFQLTAGKEPIHLATRKAELLLAYLALHPKPQSREKLAALLWGDSPDDQARGSLRKALTLLRLPLGDDLLLADREMVQLNPAYPLWVDALVFRAQAKQFLAAAEPDPRLVDIDLYRDDLLADFYEDWIDPWREELRDLYMHTMLRMIQQARAHNEHEQVIGLAQRVLMRDPAREEAHQNLMLAYTAIGQRGAALRQFDECRRALQEELGVEPTHETEALYRWVLKETAHPDRPAPLTNLPVPLTSFIGRADQIAEVKQLLAVQRLVTLTGIGGGGKTRLAVQIARDLVSTGTFQDGVWWVDLSSLPPERENMVTQAVARGVGVMETPGQSLVETLIGFLKTRQVLLVIDNCEHVISACAQLIEQLLSASIDLKVIATSREALGIPGETIWQVLPLRSPDPEKNPLLAELIQYESIQLFCERSRAVLPQFGLSSQNMTAIAQICRNLDGIPLAIELAAARMNVLSVEQIADRLGDRFALLNQGSRTKLERHQTLRAAIEWSFQLLDEAERAVLCRLAVFAGGFTLEAAEYIVKNDAEDVPVIDLLARLVDKSLVNFDSYSLDDGIRRYHLLDTIRQYAREQLRNTGETELIQDRHLQFFLELAEHAEPHLFSYEQDAWCSRLEQEHDNLLSAQDWAQESGAYELSQRLVGAIWWFWIVRNHYSEGIERLQKLISKTTSRTIARAKVLHAAGVMYWMQSDFTKALSLLREALEIGKASKDLHTVALTLRGLGGVHLDLGDFHKAQSYLDKAMCICRSLDDKYGVAFSLMHIGDCALYQEQYEQAKTVYRESAALFDELRNHNELAYPLRRMAEIACQERDFLTAINLLKRAFEANLVIDQKRGIAANLVGLALIENKREEYTNATFLLGTVDELLSVIGSRLLPADQKLYESMIARLQGLLGNQDFAIAWAAGRNMKMDQVISFALERLSEIAAGS